MQINSPKQITFEFCQSGINKTQLPFARFALLAFLGGAFIAFGGLLAVMVAGGMPATMASNPGLIRLVAGALFPIGLIMVSITGADLFTSDCTAMTLPCLQRQLKLTALLRIWCWAYIFNFIGAQFIAYFMSSEMGMFAADPWKTYLHRMATVKLEMSFYTVFMKGIGANWLVCLGAWMGFASKDVIGKVVGIWIPVMLFVTLGYEHSIANMFFVPAAIYSGAELLWGDFVLLNLIPATLGNIVGGAGLVGCVYWYCYLKE